MQSPKETNTKKKERKKERKEKRPSWTSVCVPMAGGGRGGAEVSGMVIGVVRIAK